MFTRSNVTASLRLPLAVIAAAWLQIVPASPAQPCMALASVDNDTIALANQSGVEQREYTQRVADRQLVATTEDGLRLALIPRDNPHTLVVIDASGHSASSSADADYVGDTDLDRMSQQAPVRSLRWISPTILRIAKHISPTTSRFEFYNVTQSGDASRISRPVTGDSCSMSPTSSDVACVRGGEIEVNGSRVTETNVLDFSTAIAEVEVPLQTPVSVHTDYADFNIQYLGLSGASANILVEFSEGAAAEQLVPADGYFEFPSGEQKLILKPSQLSSSRIHVTVLTAPTDSQMAIPSIAWLNGTRLLTAQNVAGSNLLAVQYSQATGTWTVARSSSLNLTVPVRDIRPLGNGRLLLRVGEDFNVASLSFSDNPPRISVGSLVTLPHVIGVVRQDGSTVQATVLHWMCPQ